MSLNSKISEQNVRADHPPRILFRSRSDSRIYGQFLFGCGTSVRTSTIHLISSCHFHWITYKAAHPSQNICWLSADSWRIMLCLSALGEDCFLVLLSWLDIRSIGYFDIALTNRQERVIWLKNLRIMDTAAIDNYGHCQSSLRWSMVRGICIKSIQFKKSKWYEITAGSFRGFAIPSILSINLQDSYVDTDDFIDVLSETFPSTRNVDLSRSKNITDAGVSALAQGCLLLTSINLSDCYDITYAGVSALAQGCPLLCSINLSDCHDITDAVVSALAQGYPLLRSIALSTCRNITDAGVSALAQGCPLLTSINLCGCHYITDAGVSALAQGSLLLSSIISLAAVILRMLVYQL